MRLFELFANVDCNIPSEAREIEITGIETNSTLTERGNLFVCISGLHTDGHKYADEAVKNGCVAVLAEHEVDACVPVIICDDTRGMLSRLFDAWYGYPSKKLKIIGVTGTNGKTSVTHMLYSIFESAMYKCGLIGTVRCYSAGREISIKSRNSLANMTTPDPRELYAILYEMCLDGVEYVFMETTSHALALGKLDAIRFYASVFTNLTPDHLDFHGTMENYFSAKKKLFSMSDCAIINIDDDKGKELASEFGNIAVTCSAGNNKADYTATDIGHLGVGGVEYRIVSSRQCFKIRSPIAGNFNIMNTLEAATCAVELGVPTNAIMTALASLCGVNGRFERIKLGKITDFTIFIDYAHTPDALENLLVSVRRIKRSDERVVLLFGCGGDRDRTKRSVMGRIAAHLADFVIVTSDNSRSEQPMSIITEIIGGMEDSDYIIIPDRQKAIEFAIREAHKGDIILLAGKGHEEYEIVGDVKRPFSEKKIAADAVLKYMMPVNIEP